MSNETRRERQMIEEAVKTYGYSVIGWSEDEYGTLRGDLGRFAPTDDDEDAGLFTGTEGNVHACVVGSKEHGNEHVAFYFAEDDMDEGGVRLRDLALQVEGI